MSDSMMPLDEALEWVAYDKSTRSTARAARTVVAQTEQIKRLQAALHKADKWGDILGNLYEDEYLLPDDMDPPA